MAERVSLRHARRLRAPDRRRHYRRLRARAWQNERLGALRPSARAAGMAGRAPSARRHHRLVLRLPALLGPAVAVAILAFPGPVGIEPTVPAPAAQPVAAAPTPVASLPPPAAPVAPPAPPARGEARHRHAPPLPAKIGRGAAAHDLARAGKGDPFAQFRVAARHATGDGLAQDYARAAAWFREAAINGLAEAQFDLAVLYEKGLGLPRDASEAVIWLQSAADQNEAAAQLRLGEIYAAGDGVPADPVAAARWLRRAAEQGVATAQRMLANCYERGEGVAASPREAYAWYRLAAASGDGAAAASVARLEGSLSAPALDEAKAAAASLASRLAATLSAAGAAAPAVGPAGLILALPDSPPGPRASAAVIGEIQRRLAAAGYDTGPADGLVGDRTTEAIRDYQRAKGLEVDGVPDMLLLNQLRAAAAGPPPAARADAKKR
jgi:localization factor PodJL